VTDLVVSTDDLATFLGLTGNLDTARAQQLLDLAVDLCTAVVNPLPSTALAVVLSAAGRAYSNPTGVTTEAAGPFQVTRPSAGVYLTKSERSALRLLTGSGGAFSFDLLPVNYPDSRFTD